VGAKVDHVRSPDTESDEKLVASNEDTTDGTRSGFSLVHGNDDGQSTDTHTVNETTSGELAPGAGGRDLDHDTDGGPESEERDTELATNDIGKSTSDEGTDSGTTTEKGGDSTLTVGTEVVGTIGVLLTETTEEVRHLPVTLRGVSNKLQGALLDN
jgi:hypothetical protein